MKVAALIDALVCRLREELYARSMHALCMLCALRSTRLKADFDLQWHRHRPQIQRWMSHALPRAAHLPSS